MQTQFWVRRDNIHDWKLVDVPETVPLAEHQIRIQISRFAFTANNVTYAVSGERLGYWKFFPVDEQGWGIVPVWGFGTVAESTHAEISTGERIYGYFPMATNLLTAPAQVTKAGFIDSAPHRQELSPIYNSYVRADFSEGFEASTEALNALLRPMFTTSFLLDDFLFDNDMFNATTIILSSASSKTAYGTAFLLDTNRKNRRDYRIVGLTSQANMPFVESLGCYDEVLAYDALTRLDASRKAAYIDFSGNQAMRRTLHEHFQDNLVHDAAVGFTHWGQAGSAKGLPGATPQFFFAPEQLQKRLKDWGSGVYRQRMGSAWLDFIRKVESWMEITEIRGQAEIAGLFSDMVDGIARPENGYMLSF